MQGYLQTEQTKHHLNTLSSSRGSTSIHPDHQAEAAAFGDIIPRPPTVVVR